jgi:hypothetical protein
LPTKAGKKKLTKTSHLIREYIESFNRSFRKECVGWGKYKVRDLPILAKEVKDYLDYYHTKRAHLGLEMKTPFEKRRLSHIYGEYSGLFKKSLW